VSDGATGPGEGFPGLNGAAQATGDEPLNRLAAALRRISAVAVGLPLPESDVAQAAEQMAALADALESAAPPVKRLRLQPTQDGHPQDFFPTSPMVGYANPVAPPVDVWAVPGPEGGREIRGRVTFDYPYEGPPTCVHGGIIAELFDEILGLANIIGGRPGMTGTLSVRYRKPTPLLAPLDLEAKVVRREGRKIFTWGAIYHQSQLTAEAEGIFIEMQPMGMLGIVAENARQTDAPVVDADFARLIADAGPD
jgi:hypothetical protein